VTRRGRGTKLLRIAQLAYAHWFFGNVYEAVVHIPDRLSSENQRLGSLLSAGSPVRYFIPGVPVLIGATVACVASGWRFRRERPWLIALGSATFVGVAATAYLVQAVNRTLFVVGQPVEPREREQLLRVWYRLNLVRLAAAAAAWLIAARLAQQR
jgi:Domain of unknown function (DUF1772)